MINKKFKEVLTFLAFVLILPFTAIPSLYLAIFYSILSIVITFLVITRLPNFIKSSIIFLKNKIEVHK